MNFFFYPFLKKKIQLIRGLKKTCRNGKEHWRNVTNYFQRREAHVIHTSAANKQETLSSRSRIQKIHATNDRPMVLCFGLKMILYCNDDGLHSCFQDDHLGFGVFEILYFSFLFYYRQLRTVVRSGNRVPGTFIVLFSDFAFIPPIYLLPTNDFFRVGMW